MEAVSKVAGATAVELGKKGLAAAKKAGVKERVLEVAGRAPLIGPFVSAAQAVIKVDPYAKIRANEELIETEKALRRALTPNERATLKKQYQEWFSTHRDTPIGKRGKR